MLCATGLRRSVDECAACMGSPFLPLQRTNAPHGPTRRMASDLKRNGVKRGDAKSVKNEVPFKRSFSGVRLSSFRILHRRVAISV